MRKLDIIFLFIIYISKYLYDAAVVHMEDVTVSIRQYYILVYKGGRRRQTLDVYKRERR